MQIRFWVVALTALLLIPAIFAVTIHGIVYDFALDELSNSIVEIDTTPRQQMVAKTGTYSFNVPPGTYTLKAYHGPSDSEIEENISALEEGSYVLDLILLPSFAGDEEFLDEEFDVPMVEELIEEQPTQWYWWVIGLAVIALLIYFFRPKKEIIKEIKHVALHDELQKIIDFIDEQGGRATQKEIRKHLPYSEAKISLMIDELEGKGLVKRIKKGRGNIITRT